MGSHFINLTSISIFLCRLWQGKNTSNVRYLSVDISHTCMPENRLNQKIPELKSNKNKVFTRHKSSPMYLLEAFKLIFSDLNWNRVSKMFVLPSKSWNRFGSEDVEGCVKCSSTWIPMFSFDTDVPQTGQIDKDGGRSMSWRYNSSRRLFISIGETLDNDDLPQAY